MKKLFIIVVIVALGLFGVAYYAVKIHPKIAAKSFKEEWTKNFSAYTGNGEVPPEWKDNVYSRRLNDGEWILAAMYHGSCAPGDLGELDVSVIRDSYGKISSLDWSPCDGGIQRIGEYWEILVPAQTIAELYQKQAWNAEQGAAANP